MRCTRVLRRIDDHVDGLLPAPEAESIRDHLDACAECREAAEVARVSSTSLASWDQVVAPSDGCFDAILRRVGSLPPETLARRPAPPWSRWASPVALAAAAAVVAAVLTANRDDPSRPTTRAAVRPETLSARLALRSVDESVHVVDQRLDDGVRRRAANPRRDTVPVVPVMFDMGFGGPR